MLIDPRVNPEGKPVALYVPKGHAEVPSTELAKQGVSVFENEDDLVSWLLGLQR